jgi:hypothetical protein
MRDFARPAQIEAAMELRVAQVERSTQEGPRHRSRRQGGVRPRDDDAAAAIAATDQSKARSHLRRSPKRTELRRTVEHQVPQSAHSFTLRRIGKHRRNWPKRYDRTAPSIAEVSRPLTLSRSTSPLSSVNPGFAVSDVLARASQKCLARSLRSMVITVLGHHLPPNK